MHVLWRLTNTEVNDKTRVIYCCVCVVLLTNLNSINLLIFNFSNLINLLMACQFFTCLYNGQVQLRNTSNSLGCVFGTWLCLWSGWKMGPRVWNDGCRVGIDSNQFQANSADFKSKETTTKLLWFGTLFANFGDLEIYLSVNKLG